MDAFFSGLDDCLRGFGMEADSIMMGMVHSAMEDARKRSCSMEGDIERLMSKSRFYELSKMQLEWSHKCLQEKMEKSSFSNTPCDRQGLLGELLNIRNSFHCRLQETNAAIADMDVEMARRKEIEMKLRLALELKGEEVLSLHTSLGLESKTDGRVLDELESSVDKQLLKVRNKLEFGRQILTGLMRSARTSGTPPAIKDLHELQDMAQLMLDLDETVADVDVLKQEVRSSFQTVAISIVLFRASTEEQHWAREVERHVANLVIASSLTRLLPVHSDAHSSPLAAEVARFQDELQALTSHITTDATDKLSCSKDVASAANKKEKTSSGRLVADLIKNHETIIQKKTQHVDPSKADFCRDKSCSLLRHYASARELIAKLYSRMERIKAESNKLIVANTFHRMRHKSLEMERIALYRNEIRKLREEKEELEIKSVIEDEIYKITLRGMISSLLDQYSEIDFELLMREKTCRIVFGEQVKEWANEISENYDEDQFIREQIYCIVFGELAKEWANEISENYDGDQFIREQINCIVFGELAKEWANEISENYDGDQFIREQINCIVFRELAMEWANEISENYEDQFIREQMHCFVSSEVIRGMACAEQSLMESNLIGTATEKQTDDACNSPGCRERQENHFAFLLKLVDNFSNMLGDFGLQACDRITANNLRLDDLTSRLNPMSEYVDSMKKNESLYRKAFLRRCYNLRTAEAEVDLLGDEVDLLCDLLQKIYVVLDHYSPVLQHYSGIIELLHMIRPQIHEDL